MTRWLASAGALLLVVLTVLAAFLVISPRRGEPTLETIRSELPRPKPKLVLIALDGADWEVMRPLMATGRLPVITAMVDSGGSGELESVVPMIAPALWTTVATGVGRRQHGVQDFVYRPQGSYEPVTVESGTRRRLAVWDILSELGYQVGVLNWYATWPADPLNGFVVSDRAASLGLRASGVTHPAAGELENAIAPQRLPSTGRFPILNLVRELEEMSAERNGYERTALREPNATFPGLQQSVADDLYTYRLARRLYRHYQPDFFAVNFRGIDAVSHFFWRYHEPNASVYGATDPLEVETLGVVVPSYYELCDRMIGELMTEMRHDTTVVVVSSHGFQAYGRPDSQVFDLDRLFAEMGLLTFEDPALVEDRTSRRVRMGATRLYSHPSKNGAARLGERERRVWFNVRDRDPDGVIDPDRWLAEREAITGRLRELRTDMGTRVFAEVRFYDGVAGDEVRRPDLILRVDRAVAGDRAIIIDGEMQPLSRRFLWDYSGISGTHRPRGVLIVHGPSVRPGSRVERAQLVDLAPTLLRLAGAPAADDMLGRVLEEILADPGDSAPESVDSYELLMRRRPPAPAGFEG